VEQGYTVTHLVPWDFLSHGANHQIAEKQTVPTAQLHGLKIYL
jgi:hypothetical protein